MSGDNLLKHRELHGLLSAAEFPYIYQTEISASKSPRKVRGWAKSRVTKHTIVVPQVLEKHGNIVDGQSNNSFFY